MGSFLTDIIDYQWLKLYLTIYTPKVKSWVRHSHSHNNTDNDDNDLWKHVIIMSSYQHRKHNRLAAERGSQLVPRAVGVIIIINNNSIIIVIIYTLLSRRLYA